MLSSVGLVIQNGLWSEKLYKFLIGFECRDAHPIERKEEHDDEDG